MRVFIVNTDYFTFLVRLYRSHPGLATASFDEQRLVRRNTHFADAYAYEDAFSALGHEALTVTANNAAMQAAWAAEHGRPLARPAILRRLRRGLRQRLEGHGRVPAGLGNAERATLLSLLVEQAASFEPDVVLVQDIHLLDRETLQGLRRHARLVVGQHAASDLGPDVPLDEYNLIVSSFQPTIDRLRAAGHHATLVRLAFDPGVLHALPAEREERWRLSFVGSLHPMHVSRLRFLEELVGLVPELRIWTPRREQLPRGSRLRERWMGPAYGVEMYEVLRSSFATVNHHGDVAPYANNLRLFEATGVGTLLLTDAKPNLGGLFEVGREVLAYETATDCAARLGSVTRLDRDAIAAAGHERTLRDHTFVERARELVDLFDEAP